DGMFMDGVLYAAVSNNLANGIGSFWFPVFSHNNLAGISDSFHEQPPLFFGIQALFFKLLGSGIYTERIYTVIILVLNIFLIKKLWELVFESNKSLQKFSWFAVLLWISIPVCFWSFSNNMIENTVSVFLLAAVIFQWKAFHSNNKNGLLFIVIAGVFIFLGSLTKGLPALFPLVFPLVYRFFNLKYSIKKMFIHLAVMVITISGIYFLLLLNNEAKQSLYNYFYLRLLKRINDVPTTTSYFYIVWRMLLEAIVPFSIAIILKLLTLKNKFQINNKHHVLFITLAFCGILPLTITLVQKGFYFVPALPFLAIGLAIYSVQNLNYLFNRLSDNYKIQNVLKWSFNLILIGSIAFTYLNFGRFSREKDLLQDIHTIGKTLPTKEIINCTPELLSNWSLQPYLSRYYFISLDINQSRHYYLCTKTDFESNKLKLLENLSVIEVQLNNFVLLKAN
ncbi:MAG: glycosyltransferase family 39 protein, partial [Bacteroidia bacterium]|nr:glycosyltransferase family 39 protein [Bacteroidia bacterium]